MRRSPAVAAVALLVVVTSACAPAAAQEVRSDKPRANAEVAAATRATQALDAIAVDLYRVLSRTPANLVYSPYSVAVALAMSRAGAANETARQLDQVLHASLAGDLDGGFNALEQTLAKRPGKYKAGDQTFELELETANRLWGQKDLTFEATFLDRLAAYYGAGMQVVDYRTAHEPARRTINAWVAARTRDRIRDLIPEGALDEFTRLVITNAIYLRARWAYQFETAVAAPFHRPDGSQSEAQLMRLSERLRYGAGDGYRAVELPYLGGLSMVAIVPDAGRLGVFESSLDGPRLRRIVDGLTDTQVDLWTPKFEFRSEASLKDALSELGMPIAFTDDADFSGITKEERLAIADVIHQAFIAVDEKGTEAAAATGVIFRPVSAPLVTVELRIDRPFLFLIADRETGAVLFMGRVLDPRG